MTILYITLYLLWYNYVYSNADIEVEDKSLMTPLMLATKNEHEEVRMRSFYIVYA